MRNRTTECQLTATLQMMAVTTPFATDPPPWAPTHGYRDKHKHKHKHEHHDDDDERYPTTGYVVNGICNCAALGGVAGGLWAPAAAMAAAEIPRL